MKETTFSIYACERDCLKPSQIDEILDRGHDLLSGTDLVNTLSGGGSLFFPHTSILKCGDQIAAAALASLLACQRSGKNQVLALGVLHGYNNPLFSIYSRELEGKDISGDPLRRIFGPGLPFEELISEEYSLESYFFLLQHAAQRLNMDMPKVVSRYPVCICGDPASLPGIEELKQRAKESIVVATADLYHHGRAYGLSPEQSMPISPAAYDLAAQVIEGGLRLLAEDDLKAILKYCWDTLSDARDVAQMLRFLLGPLEGYIRDLTLVDIEYLYDGNPKPSWVAASLVELKKV